MKSRSSQSTWVIDRWSYLYLALFTLLSLFTSGRWVIPAFVWITPVFAIRFMRTQPLWRGFGLTWLAAFATSALCLWGIMPASSPAMYFASMAVAVSIGCLPLLIDRSLTPRFRRAGSLRAVSTLIFPLASTAVEWFMFSNSPMGSWGASAYTQFGNPLLMQLTSVTGLWGSTFLIGWIASLVNWVWEVGVADFRARRVAIGVAVGALFLIGLAYARPWLTPTTPETVRIASFTVGDKAIGDIIPLLSQDRDAFRSETQTLHQEYLVRTIAEADAGAKIVLWPEGAGLGLAEDVDALVLNGQRLADEKDIYLAMPVAILFPDEDRPFENRLLIADPQGAIVLDHVKFGGNEFEGSLRGDGVLQTVETPYGLLSSVICWDTDFPVVLRQAGRLGVDILLSPANDWQAISPQHGQMSAFRAVENGMTVVRQANHGFSLITDPLGRTLAAADHFAGQRSMVSLVPTSGVVAIYPLIGDVMGWGSALGLLAMIIWALVLGRTHSNVLTDSVQQPAQA